MYGRSDETSRWSERWLAGTWTSAALHSRLFCGVGSISMRMCCGISPVGYVASRRSPHGGGREVALRERGSGRNSVCVGEHRLSCLSLSRSDRAMEHRPGRQLVRSACGQGQGQGQGQGSGAAGVRPGGPLAEVDTALLVAHHVVEFPHRVVRREPLRRLDRRASLSRGRPHMSRRLGELGDREVQTPGLARALDALVDLRAA